MQSLWSDPFVLRVMVFAGLFSLVLGNPILAAVFFVIVWRGVRRNQNAK
jgi:hypothetical protein